MQKAQRSLDDPGNVLHHAQVYLAERKIHSKTSKKDQLGILIPFRRLMKDRIHLNSFLLLHLKYVPMYNYLYTVAQEHVHWVN